jgi:hypothetical protein
MPILNSAHGIIDRSVPSTSQHIAVEGAPTELNQVLRLLNCSPGNIILAYDNVIKKQMKKVSAMNSTARAEKRK